MNKKHGCLTPAQMRELKREFDKTGEFIVEEMDTEFTNSVCAMNDHELFWIDANRFLSDLQFEKQMNQSPF